MRSVSGPNERSTSAGLLPREGRSETSCVASWAGPLRKRSANERVDRHARLAKEEKQGRREPWSREPPPVRSPALHIPKGHAEPVGVVESGTLASPPWSELQGSRRTTGRSFRSTPWASLISTRGFKSPPPGVELLEGPEYSLFVRRVRCANEQVGHPPKVVLSPPIPEMLQQDVDRLERWLGFVRVELLLA